MKTKKTLLLICLLAFITSAYAAERVKGNGTLTSKKIEVGDYNEIRINGVVDYYYVQSDNPSAVEVTVDENLHPYIHIDVKDRVLTIEFKGAKVDHYTKFIVKTNSKWLKAARINGNANFMVESPLTGDELEIKANANSLIQLKEPVKMGKIDLNVRGSANIVVTELEADEIVCDLDGSGSITLKKGKAKDGKYSITGGSDIHAYGFEVPFLTCKITGKGLAEAYVTENLRANVIGKGEIYYKGQASVQQKIIGKGKIQFVE